MPTPDHDVKGAALPSVLRVLIVSGDAVAAVLAARLFERLGHPRPERLASLADADAQQARFELLLVDADLKDAGQRVADWMQARDRLPRILVMSSAEADIRADARLRKPLSLEALTAALASVATAGAAPEQAAAVILAELRQQFGDDGAAQLVGALVDDLPAQQQRVAAAIRDGDLGALKRAAHTLRGVGLQLGATALVQLGDETEQVAVRGDRDTAIALGARLIQCHATLVENLRDAARRR